MKSLLVTDGFAIRTKSPTLTMSLDHGRSLAIMGPAGSGKSRFLATLCGLERPAVGSSQLMGEAAFARAPASRRARVRSLVRSRKGEHPLQRMTRFLIPLHLDSERETPYSKLGVGMAAAADILSLVTGEEEILAVDETLDRLDPWTLVGALKLLDARRSAGSALIVVTNRPDLLANFDAVIVLKEGHVRFSGGRDDLLRHGPAAEMTVVTNRHSSVRAMASPFKVEVSETPEGLMMKAADGQELAAKLLTEGYGEVKLIVTRNPSVEEALLSL